MEALKLVLAAVLPLVGVVVGAGLQYYFSRSAESRKQLAVLRARAYVDYLRCVAESARAHLDHQEQAQLLARAADAKARISVFGSVAVLDALADFERHDAAIKSPSSEGSFLRLASAMRLDAVGGRDAPSVTGMRLVLFGNSDRTT